MCPPPLPQERDCLGGMGGGGHQRRLRAGWLTGLCGEKIGARARAGGRKTVQRWIVSRMARPKIPSVEGGMTSEMDRGAGY
jgi:hypothetical protein